MTSTKIMKKVVHIEQELNKGYPRKDVQLAITQAKRLIPTTHVDVARLISGKTYLLPLLYHHLRSKARFSGTLDQLKARLARYCEIDVDPGLLSAIRRASRSRPA
jgi:hypothetical protein